MGSIIFDVQVTFLDEKEYIMDQNVWQIRADSSEEARDKAQAIADNDCENYDYYEAEISIIGA